jgi:hypothetical protein
MSHTKFAAEGLRSFFERFQSLSAAADINGLVAMYAERIMIAGRRGTMTISPADIMGAIPKRKQMIESAGHRATTLVGFEEESLTERYSLVRTQWRWDFAPSSGDSFSVTLPSTFIVDRGGEMPRIAVYINDHDITAVLSERGL